MARLKLAFDPKTMLNPGKVIPNDIYQEEDIYVKNLTAEYIKSPSLISFINNPEIQNIEKLELDNYILKGKKAGYVLKPKNVNEVATIVRLSNKYDLDLVPWGKGSKISEGNSYGPNCIVISLEALDKIVDLDPENLTVTVEAGIQLSDLQSALYNKGYMLPVDPIGEASHSIGGLIATNSTGSLRLQYGNFNNMVLGLQGVTSDGKIINYGGKMIKNVAGYDLRKLFIGSWGTLGIITQGIMKLSIMPERSVYRTYITDKYISFLEFINAIQKADFHLTSFDFVARDSKYYVNLCMSGQTLSVEKQVKILDHLLDHLVGKEIKLVEEIEDPYLTNGKKFIEKYTMSSEPRKIVIKSSILFSKIPEWIEKVSCHDKNDHIIMYGNVANGICYAIVTGEDDEVARVYKDIGASLKESFVFGAHTLEASSGILPDGETRCDNLVSQRLKKIFDPKNILNPGRIIGGRMI
jgi:hypothetical protein